MIEQVPKSVKEDHNPSKKAYQKPTITSEPLCSDMALCACDEESGWKQGDYCTGMGFADGPS